MNSSRPCLGSSKMSIMGNFEGWKRLLDIVKSPANGMTFDPGVCKEMGLDPVEVLRYGYKKAN